jgi:hypothetical protein
MKIVLKSLIIATMSLFLITACSDQDENKVVNVVAEPKEAAVVPAPPQEPEPVATYIPTDQIAGVRLEEAELTVDTTEALDTTTTFTEAEKLVCDDENLPDSITGSSATLYVCPQNDWTSQACITVDVSHCRTAESFCRCVLGNDIADSDFRRHDTWLLKGQNEFTYLSKP